MKRTKYLLSTCLLTILSISCSEEDIITSDSNKIVYDISIDKQNAFINDEINLTFNSNSYDNISLNSEEPDITITSTSDTSYKLSSTQPISGIIEITSTHETTTQTNKVLVNFHQHGTTDYNNVESITLGTDNQNHILLLHGEPEGIKTETETVTSVSDVNGVTTERIATYQHWYYFSKGLSFKIEELANSIISISVYGDTWEAKIDNGEIKTGEIYPYEIADLGNFNDGILMDDVVAKFGNPHIDNKLSSTTSDNLHWYYYADLNSGLISTQKGEFYFNSDDVLNHQGQNVNRITFD